MNSLVIHQTAFISISLSAHLTFLRTLDLGLRFNGFVVHLLKVLPHRGVVFKQPPADFAHVRPFARVSGLVHLEFVPRPKRLLANVAFEVGAHGRFARMRPVHVRLQGAFDFKTRTAHVAGKRAFTRMNRLLVSHEIVSQQELLVARVAGKLALYWVNSLVS